MSPLDRLEWLAAVVSIPGIRASGRDAAVALAQFINSADGTARPSIATLAAAIAADPRTVQRGLRDLEAAGLLSVDHPAGRACCTYRPINPGNSARVQPRQIDHGRTCSTPAIPSSQPRQIVSPTPVNLPPEQGEQGYEQGTEERFAPAPVQDDEPHPGPGFILHDGSTWTPPDDLMDALERAFPGVDLDQELAKAAAWCMANQAKRKKARGMPKFINGWLGRASGAHHQREDSAPAEREVSADELRELLTATP